MEILYILLVVLIMVSMTALYFFVGYRFLRKNRGGKNGDN